MEHVKNALKRRSIQKLASQLADLEREALNLRNLHLDKKVSLKHAIEYLKREQETFNQIKGKIEENKRRIKQLKDEIPGLEEELAEVYRRMELRRNEIEKLEKEEKELRSKLEKIDGAILQVKAEMQRLKEK